MMVPTIHRNGTSKESLLEGYIAAGYAVQTALAALCETAPNGRDYYPQEIGALTKATMEHNARESHLRAVLSELLILVGRITEA
jgi:hypothetical protein